MQCSQREGSDATVSQMHTNNLTKTSLGFRLMLLWTDSSHYSQQYEKQLANSFFFLLYTQMPSAENCFIKSLMKSLFIPGIHNPVLKNGKKQQSSV